ncbi:hypothetical protein CCR75_001363 [Bremia lactucae]|uniref:Uncharacterized protein n=1 Tax=Bremia lactucae TaxID=4779 RepID=A0A976FEM4_BRELC|nr:hypothetical protein CCR75_001363 [Bremia lactucae]
MNHDFGRRRSNEGVWPALLDAAEHIFWKLQLYSIALLHLFFSTDKQWLQGTPNTHASAIDENASVESTTLCMDPEASVVTKTKRIVFVRHAESEWNVIFNRGFTFHAIVRFVRSLGREWLLLPTNDSILLDSPLSQRGRFQAHSLRDRVCNRPLYPIHDNTAPFYEHSPQEREESSLLRYLFSPVPGSVVVASNLRRSIDTARLVSAARLEVPGERIHVLSCLQEIGRNLDTLAISTPHNIQPHEVLVQGPQGEKHHEELFSVAENYGNKAILGSGRNRLFRFAQWIFKHPSSVVIVYGHSLWFRAFCREFLPQNVNHEAKSLKIGNCHVVTFLLEEYGRGEMVQYNIQPESFQHL